MLSDWPRGVFAWEYVNMVVASRCFAFRALITQARIWKSFRVQNSTSLLYLPIPSSAKTWKIFTNKLCQYFFAKADILSEKNPYFGKHLFAKQELITLARLCVQDFVTGKNFTFNQCHNKELCVFLSEKSFYKSNRKLFSCVCIVWYKHLRDWENSQQLCKPSTSSQVCITVPTPLVVISGYMQTWKMFSIANTCTCTSEL